MLNLVCGEMAENVKNCRNNRGDVLYWRIVVAGMQRVALSFSNAYKNKEEGKKRSLLKERGTRNRDVNIIFLMSGEKQCTGFNTGSEEIVRGGWATSGAGTRLPYAMQRGARIFLREMNAEFGKNYAFFSLYVFIVPPKIA